MLKLRSSASSLPRRMLPVLDDEARSRTQSAAADEEAKGHHGVPKEWGWQIHVRRWLFNARHRPFLVMRDVAVGMGCITVLLIIYVWAAVSGYLEPSVRGATMVLYCRSALPFTPAPAGQAGKGGMERWSGMFSEVHSVLGALRYAERHGAVAVRPHFTSPPYANAPGDNWWEYHFAPTMQLDDYADGAPEVHFSGWVARFGRFGGFGRFIFGDGATLPYFPVRGAIHRREGQRLWRRYVRPRAHVTRKVDAFHAKYLAPCRFVLGIHYRGTDTRQHYPYRAVPYEAMLREALLALKSRGVTSRERPGLCTFVATDEQDFVDYLATTPLGPTVVSYDGSPRVAAASDALHFSSSLGVDNAAKGESALVDCLLLSAAAHLVKTRSAVSDTSVLINADMPFTLVLADDEVYRVEGENTVVPYDP